MVEKIKKSGAAIIECKDFNLKEGDIENPLWIIETEDKLKVAIDLEEYISIMEDMKKLLKENFDLKLEREILSEFPVDYDDVKAVVLEEMKENPEKKLEDIVKKVKLEHPNLFYEIDVDNFF